MQRFDSLSHQHPQSPFILQRRCSSLQFLGQLPHVVFCPGGPQRPNFLPHHRVDVPHSITPPNSLDSCSRQCCSFILSGNVDCVERSERYRAVALCRIVWTNRIRSARKARSNKVYEISKHEHERIFTIMRRCLSQHQTFTKILRLTFKMISYSENRFNFKLWTISSKSFFFYPPNDGNDAETLCKQLCLSSFSKEYLLNLSTVEKKLN